MSRALSGKRILVTRPREQIEGFVQELSDLGATIILSPAIEIQPTSDTAAFDDAIRKSADYQWIVLTSVNGVDQFRQRLDALDIRIEQFRNVRFAVIGPATGDALRQLGREPDAMPGSYVSEAIAEALGNVKGSRILLARANLARPELSLLLRERGAIVHDVIAYDIVPAEMSPQGPCPDYITLTSAAIAGNTITALREQGKESWLRDARIACIGPITASAVEQAGYRVAVIASEFTIPGLIAALCMDASQEMCSHV